MTSKSKRINFSLVPTDIPNLRLLSNTSTLKNYLYTTLQHLPDGHTYPPVYIRATQSVWATSHLEHRQSTFASGGFGLFTKIDLPENTLLGFYGGQISSSIPADTSYVLELSRSSPYYCKHVDAKDFLHQGGYLGLINEYIWSLDSYDPHTLQNCKFSLDGTGAVYTTRDIPAGTELTIYLGPSYDWSSLIYIILSEYLLTYGLPPIDFSDMRSSPLPHIIAAMTDITVDTTSPWHYRRRNKPALNVCTTPAYPKPRLLLEHLPQLHSEWIRFPHSDVTAYMSRLDQIRPPSHLPEPIWRQLGSQLSHKAHYTQATMSFLTMTIRRVLPSSHYILTQSDTDKLMQHSFVPPPGYEAYSVIFNTNNTWQLYHLDTTLSLSYFINPKSFSSLNVQLHTRFTSQLLPLSYDQPVTVHSVDTPMIPDVYISGPFVLYMVLAYYLHWPIPNTINSIKHFHSNLFHSMLQDSYTFTPGSTPLVTIPTSVKLIHHLPDVSQPFKSISSTVQPVTPSPTPDHYTVLPLRSSASSSPLSQITCSQTTLLSPTPIFTPERICQLLHKPGLRHW